MNSLGTPQARPGSPGSAEYDHAYFDATVLEIEKFQDVDMKEAETESQPEVHFVLDTNVLLHHLDVVRQFVSDIEAHALPLLVIIPRTVLSELDRQKNRKDLAWFSRRATAWILEKVKERKTLRGQRRGQESNSSRETDVHRANDLSIADCAEYFSHKSHTFLCSGDKNLCIECEFRGIPTVAAPQREWCSRDIMAAMFPAFPRLDAFATHQRAYRPSAKVQTLAPPDRQATVTRAPDDSMDVDDDNAAEFLLPSHALDSLHIQIIEHFRGLLQELVLRIGGSSLAGGAARSSHAPAFTTKPYYEWTSAQALEYIGLRRKLPISEPRLDLFMALPYSVRGARRGQDWPRRAWDQALAALTQLGKDWNAGAIVESVSVLPFHCERIFLMPMRPTGM